LHMNLRRVHLPISLMKRLTLISYFPSPYGAPSLHTKIWCTFQFSPILAAYPLLCSFPHFPIHSMLLVYTSCAKWIFPPIFWNQNFTYALYILVYLDDIMAY
jgi:hypothetical protein